jgi:hypothetical protein
MMIRQLLAIIGRRNPAIYDVVFPHGPIIAQGASQLAHNFQPLPPDAMGAAIASEFIQTARMANRFGLNQGVAFEDLDDWCPTTPKKFKLPPSWPPIPEPEPHPEWFVDFHLGFAARLAAVADKLEGDRLRESLDKAIDRSMNAIEGAMNSMETSMKTTASKKS